jgi:hypothetical protein
MVKRFLFNRVYIYPAWIAKTNGIKLIVPVNPVTAHAIHTFDNGAFVGAKQALHPTRGLNVEHGFPRIFG